MTLRLLTWNLQWQFGDWQARQPAIAQVLRSEDPNIALLQETLPAQITRLANERDCASCWAGYQRPDSDDPSQAMGNAIVSRWPIEHHDHRFLQDRQGRSYRTILGASVASPHGRLNVFVTHLEHRYDQSTTRIAQLQAASEFIEEFHTAHTSELPPVLGGDLNAVADSDEIRKLTGRSEPYVDGRIWSDAWEQVGHGPGVTWSGSNPANHASAWPNRRLDYVLIGWPRPQRPVGNPVSAHLVGTEPVDGVVASDHYGVAVTIHTP